jgi:flagellar hook-associated protein 2
MTTTSTGVSALNISGLASGLDTNTIVTQLMAIEKVPQDRIVQQQTLQTTRQNDLMAIQSQLRLLSSALTAVTSPSTWTTAQAVSSSDPTHVAATGNGVPTGGFQVSVSRLARGAQLTQSSAVQAATGNDQLTVQVGADPSKAFTVAVTTGDSLDVIARSINTAGNQQVFASVINAKLVISSQVPGAANTIAVSSTGGGTAAADLGLTQTVAPQDAEYSVDGGALQTSASNVITNIATGLNVTLLGVTASPASITVTAAAANTATVQAAITDFVSAYNATIDMVSAKVNERKVVNPQTDDDRAKGDLQGDQSLVALLSRLRTSVADLVTGRPGTMNSLAQAGVSTGASVGSGALNQSSIQGDLTLDSAKLSAALSTQFDSVKALFTNVTGTYDSEGLVQRQNAVLNTFIGTGGALSSAIASQASRITELGTQKAAWDIRLAQRELTLRRQYAAMETALQSAQSQGTWLTGQLAALPKFS